jgi:phage terminase small subunit
MSMSPAASPASTSVICLTARRESFCLHMASGAGGAEAARRAGFSPKGAKQRANYLMTRPEIRIRIDQLRNARRAEHKAHLDNAVELVGAIIADAMQHSSNSVALRAIEFQWLNSR